MRAIKYRELRQMYDGLGPQECCKRLREAIAAKELAPQDFSLRELAEATLGNERVRMFDPRGGSLVMEAGAFDGVDATAFSNITGQIVYSTIMAAYMQEAFVMSGLVDTIPTRLSGEKIPGIAKLSDEAETVHDGMLYPSYGFGEDYVETPATTKRGFIVPVTKEAIFFDRTNLVLQRAAEVGEVLGLNKEKRLLDLALGVTNNYKWKGTSYDTYSTDGTTGTGGGTGLVINALTNTLNDWTDIDEAEQLFANILDPNTGEPVLVNATDLLVMPAYRHVAHRILHATEIRYTASGAATQTLAPNPFQDTDVGFGRQYQPHVSRLAYRRLIASGVAAADAKKYWLFGDFRKAFAYMENWPITVTQAPVNSEAEFSQDIVARFKCSERGAAAVLNPRFVVRSTGAS